MSDASRIRLGRWLAGSTLVLSIGAMLSVAAVGSWDYLARDVSIAGVLALAFGGVAWIVQPVQPRNLAVWVLTWSGFAGALTAVGAAARSHYDVLPENFDDFLDIPAADLPLAAALIVYPARFIWIAAFFAPLMFGVLLFPDGKLPSPRWRLVGWASAILMAISMSRIAILWHPWSDFTYETSEIGDLAVLFDTIVFVGAMMLSVACWLALVLRYRRSNGETRKQIRSVGVGTLAAMLVGTATMLIEIITSGAAPTSTTDENDVNVVSSVGPTLMALCIAAGFVVAILRFRLYGLDVIVSKSIVYLSIAALISAVYVVAVILVGRLAGEQLTFVSSLLAMIVAAVVLQPMRQVIDRVANRLVFGHRIAPYEMLASFASRATNLAGDELIARAPQLVVDGTSAAHAAVWSRVDGGFEITASSIARAGPEAIAGEQVFLDMGADHSIPIVHEGELLGGLSIVLGRGEVVQPAELGVLNDLAAGLGVALRNTQLVDELRQTVQTLETSRARVLSATTLARRELEADLERGPQRNLDLLRSGLELARSQAMSAGLAPVANFLENLEADLDGTTTTMRDLASGIYPRTLENAGLQAAIEEHGALTTIPVSVQSETLPRYTRDVEAAIYFTVLEALQNAVKHASASTAAVTLDADESGITFEVRDDGHGFDLATVRRGAGLNGMFDRMDTVGATIDLTANPATGTTIRGHVPTSVPQPSSR